MVKLRNQHFDRAGRHLRRADEGAKADGRSKAANSKMKAATDSGGITILGIEIGNFRQ